MKNKLLKGTIIFFVLILSLLLISGCGSQKENNDDKKTLTLEQLTTSLKDLYNDLSFSTNDTGNTVSFSYEDDDVKITGTANKSNVVQTVVVVHKDIDRTKIISRSKMEDIILRLSSNPGSLTLNELNVARCYLSIAKLYYAACGEYNLPVEFLNALCDQTTLTAGEWKIEVTLIGDSLKLEMN